MSQSHVPLGAVGVPVRVRVGASERPTRLGRNSGRVRPTAATLACQSSGVTASSQPPDAAPASDAAPTAGAPGLRVVGSLLARAAVLGPVVSLAVGAFVVIEHQLQSWLWEDAPGQLGMSEPAAWWVVVVLLAGAVLTAAALRLPGRGGHAPLDGFSFDIGPREVGSVVAAALASLSFGVVLGPEAPALAIGTALGAVVAAAGARSPDPAARRVLMLAGGAAAFGLVLGSPLAVGLFVLEAALLSRQMLTAVALLPLAVALAFGYLVQIGIAGWPGIGETSITVPDLASYAHVGVIDLLLALPLGLVVGAIVAGALHGARRLRAVADARPPVAALVPAALGIAAAALAVRAITGEPVEAVLFSGQNSIPLLLSATSAGTLLVVVVGKAIAYLLSLASGFRGGPIFPALALGAGLAAVLALAVPTASQTGLLAAGLAAGGVAAMRLPLSATLLAVLLTIPAGSAVTSSALLGAATGLLAAMAVDRLRGVPTVPPPQGADQPTSS
jgi:H+/Cl- antiporter ClcA